MSVLCSEEEVLCCHKNLRLEIKTHSLEKKPFLKPRVFTYDPAVEDQRVTFRSPRSKLEKTEVTLRQTHLNEGVE